MTCRSLFMLLMIALLLVAQPLLAADPVYREKNKYPTLDEIRARRDAVKAERDSIRAAVDADYAARNKEKKDAALDLRVDWSAIDSPAKPEDFTQLWHLPPVPQYYTGTCWAFCSTSLMESEAHRLAGVDIKLSEMFTVYWEYVEKCRSYLRSFGHTPLAQGGQDNGTLAVIKQYGAVPHDQYPGVLNAEGWHDHGPMLDELKGFLDWVLASGTWDEEQNLAYVRSILDKHLGTPPGDVLYEGKSYSPKAFAREVLKLNPDDYVACVSRMDTPFYSKVLLDVPDNWRRKDDYLNLPLHDFYQVIQKSLKAGYSLSIGGDNSEPGMDGKFDTAVIPEWDIPAKYINQGSREFRIVNGTTGDDHGLHLVGYTRQGGQDWYLIKDSNRSSRLGEFKGYYFWSGDYIKLKMLSFTVHKDMLKGLLN
jgi:bleomycin hydrolase